jgi:WD40 repeat protein
LAAAAILLLTGLLGQARAQSGDKPMLLIETGRHSAPITAISASKDGSTFATSSQDKSVRIWDAAGRQIQVIRPPVGSRVNQAVNSVAISPDGRLVAYQFSKLDRLEEKGNFVSTFPIQVLNLKTQKLDSLGRTFEPVRLGFSPDGRYLAWITAFSSDMGISLDVVRTSDWATYGRASRKATKNGFGAATFDFAPDGNRIVATFGDHAQVLSINGKDYASKNLFDDSKCVDGNPYCAVIAEDMASKKRMAIEKALSSEHGKQPIGAKWSPDGKWLAFGYLDTPSVTLVSTAKWEQIELPASQLEATYFNGPKSMATLAWSQNSKTLLSTGTMGAKFSKPTVIRQWTVGTKPTYEDEDATTGKDRKLGIKGLVATSAGYVFASDDAIGFYEGGRFRVLDPSAGIRGNWRVYNTADGSAFYFMYPNPGQLLGDTYGFDVLNRTLKPEPRELPNSFNALEKAPGMENFGLLSDKPILNGVRLEIDSRSSAYAFTPDGQTLLIGTSYSLYRFDRNGSKLWRVDLPAGATALNASRDGRLILVVLNDGTLRWHRLLDGKELLAFYALNDRRSWAMWTPDGYFDASDSGSIVLAKGTRRDDGLIDAEPLSTSSSMRRPDKINAALTRMEYIGEAAPIPAKP